jgi:hypothetical protein
LAKHVVSHPNGRVAALSISLLLAGCAVNAPRVSTEAECRERYGERVVAVGVYRPMELPTSARPGSPLVPTDRAYVELDDGHALAIETHDLAFRPPEERARLSGRLVAVTARLERMAQLWGTPEEAAIIMDALKEIESIVPLEPSE